MQEIHKNLFWSATKPPSHQKSTTKVIWLNVRWWPIYHGQKLIYLISKKNIIRQSYMQFSISIKSSWVCACGFNNIIVMPASTLRVRWNRSPTASLEGKRYDEEWMNKNETAKYYANQLKGLEFAKLTIPLFCLSVHRECAGNGCQLHPMKAKITGSFKSVAWLQIDLSQPLEQLQIDMTRQYGTY